MTTPRIEEKISELGKPNNLWVDGKNRAELFIVKKDWLEEVLTEAHQAWVDEAVEMLKKEVDIHNAYPMTWEQESKTFVDGILHAIKALQDNK